MFPETDPVGRFRGLQPPYGYLLIFVPVCLSALPLMTDHNPLFENILDPPLVPCFIQHIQLNRIREILINTHETVSSTRLFHTFYEIFCFLMDTEYQILFHRFIVITLTKLSNE
jgi:hypothetical protein